MIEPAKQDSQILKLAELAIKQDHSETLQRLLLEKKISPQSKISIGNVTSPLLHLTAENNSWRCCDTLIQAGANVEAVNSKLKTASHIALENGHTKLGEKLMMLEAKRVSVSSQQAHGQHSEQSIQVSTQKLVMQAALHDLPDIISYLAEKNVELNFTTTFGYTPLHLAAGNNSLNATKTLIAYGSNTGSLDQQHRSPKQLAIFLSAEKTIEYFNSIDQNKQKKLDEKLPNRNLSQGIKTKQGISL